MKFELINKEGCLMDTINIDTEITKEENAYIEARKYFASKFSGNYTIIDKFNGLTRNVRLR